MASLEGQSINTSYQGLLKTEANDGLGNAQRRITTGEGTESGLLLNDSYEVRIEGAGSGYGNLTGKLGNLNLVNLDQDGGIFMSDFSTPGQTTITIGTTQAGDSTNFLGAVDFASATVTGLPSAAGLVAGTAANSMRSSDTLTTIPAQADSVNNIAIGNDAQAKGGGGFPRQNIAIGYQSRSNNENGVAIGSNAQAGTYGTSLGASAFSFGVRGFAGGLSTNAGAFSTVAIGNYNNANHEGAVCIGGYGANSGGDFAIAIGREVSATTDGIAMGRGATSSAAGSVALGQGVTSAKINTVSVKALETQTPSTPTAGGIVMKDAGSTERRLNIDASGNLQIDSTPVGGGLTAYTQTTPLLATATGADEILGQFTIPAGTFGAGDVLLFKALNGSTAGLNFFAYWLSNSNTLFTGDPIATGNGSEPSIGFEKSIYIENNTSARWFDENFRSDAGDTKGNFSLVNSTVDWTQTVYVNFTAYADPGNVAYLYGASLTKMN